MNTLDSHSPSWSSEFECNAVLNFNFGTKAQSFHYVNRKIEPSWSGIMMWKGGSQVCEKVFSSNCRWITSRCTFVPYNFSVLLYILEEARFKPRKVFTAANLKTLHALTVVSRVVKISQQPAHFTVYSEKRSGYSICLWLNF